MQKWMVVGPLPESEVTSTHVAQAALRFPLLVRLPCTSFQEFNVPVEYSTVSRSSHLFQVVMVILWAIPFLLNQIMKFNRIDGFLPSTVNAKFELRCRLFCGHLFRRECAGGGWGVSKDSEVV